VLPLWPRHLHSVQEPAHPAAVAGRGQLLHVHLRPGGRQAGRQADMGRAVAQCGRHLELQPTMRQRECAPNTRNTRPPTHPLQLAQWLVGGERIALASGALKASVIASVTNQKGLALALCSGQARRGWAGGIQAGMWMRKGGMLISANTRQAPAAKPQGQWGC
jgi:hypothetical protein